MPKYFLSSESKFNSGLAHRVLDYIRMHPDEWNQTHWNTCFAGIALKLAGYTFAGAFVRDSNGNVAGHINEVARDVLGVGYFCPLFDSSRTLNELEVMVNDWPN